MKSVLARRLIRIALGLVLLAVALVAALILSRNWLAKTALTAAIRQRTGWETSLGAVELGMRDGSLRISNLKIFNPPRFGGGPFLDLPELYLAYNAEAAATNALQFREIRLHLAEVQIVVDATGKTNLTELQKSLGDLDSAEAQTRAGSLRFTGIDTLVLTVGRVSFRDLRPGGVSREFSAGLRNETLHQVRSWVDIVPLGVKLFLGSRIITIEPEPKPTPAPVVGQGTTGGIQRPPPR
jgi:hypothetical protein